MIGSLAIRIALVKKWLHNSSPNASIIAFDVKSSTTIPVVLTQGWQSDSQQLLWDVLDAYEDSGLKHILCTDVSRDGMLTGANTDLYKSLSIMRRS